eukprot:8256195-Pyramimonas_sp.AAC.1
MSPSKRSFRPLACVAGLIQVPLAAGLPEAGPERERHRLCKRCAPATSPPVSRPSAWAAREQRL